VNYNELPEIIDLRNMWPPPHTIVFTNGCFDLLHPGHVKIIQHAGVLAGMYGAVIVGVNDDDSVRRYKGNDRPIVPIEDRVFLVENIAMPLLKRFIVLPFSEDTPIDLIRAVKPNIVLKGGDYTPEQVVGHDVDGVEIAIFSLVPGKSSTNYREKLNV